MLYAEMLEATGNFTAFYYGSYNRHLSLTMLTLQINPLSEIFSLTSACLKLQHLILIAAFSCDMKQKNA
jgi:hypothetical protein